MIRSLAPRKANSNTSSSPQTPPPTTAPPASGHAAAAATREANSVESIAQPRVKKDTTRRARKSMIRIKPSDSTEDNKTKQSFGRNPIPEEQLEPVWNAYVDRLKQKSGGFTSSVLVNCEPKLKEDKETIHLVFRNETNEIEFNRISFDLLEHLKAQFKNDHIEFTTEVNKAKAKKTLYTNKEKFDHMAEKHPKLNEWLEKLGLELK